MCWRCAFQGQEIPLKGEEAFVIKLNSTKVDYSIGNPIMSLNFSYTGNNIHRKERIRVISQIFPWDYSGHKYCVFLVQKDYVF